MPESILIDITTVIVLGIGSQWLAWRFRLPSILLLLVAGFLAGPVLGVLSPAALQGDWVFAFVSVSIGIILFEGGLSLRVSELQAVGSSVRNLISVGVFVTWGLGGLAAYYILGLSISLSVLLGAILTVTGPTVVVPLLRHVRPKGRVSTIAKWEGITIDPVGAIIAVLVLETILLMNAPVDGAATAAAHGGAGLSHAAEALFRGLMLEVVVALGVGVAATAILLLILRRRLVPDFLRNPVTLMIVVTAFTISNVLQEESGLLTTTLMGIALANQPWASVQRIVEFKENLQVLLIGTLFITLSARLEMSAMQYIDGQALLFLGILVLAVRPLAVFISSIGTKMEFNEKIFLSWLAPRGIVAAAVGSLFAYKLRDIYPQEVDALVPIIFLVIVGTVAIYGLTAAPLARWMGLADANPQGILFIGSEKWVRKIAHFVYNVVGHRVLMIDSNPDHIQEAQREGLPAQRANALSESVLDELDISGIGRLLITIPNDEVGSLTALHFSEIFETTDIFQLAAQPDSRQSTDVEMPSHLRGRPLFGEHTSYQMLKKHFERGDELKLFKLAEDATGKEKKKEFYTYEDLTEQYEGYSIIPLFVIRNGVLQIVSEMSQFSLKNSDRLIALVGTNGELDEAEEEDTAEPVDPTTPPAFEMQEPSRAEARLTEEASSEDTASEEISPEDEDKDQDGANDEEIAEEEGDGPFQGNGADATSSKTKKSNE